MGEGGGTNVNGTIHPRKGNEAIVFSHSVPHSGIGHNDGIRIFFYIDFALFVNGSSQEKRNDSLKEVSPIDDSDISIITSDSIDRAVIEVYMYGRSELKNKK